MPCESAVQTDGLMVASTASQSLGASGGPHQVNRFHVCHVTQPCQDQQLPTDQTEKALAAIDHKCEELHSAVGILDSLPWCRGGPAAAVAAVAAVFRAIPELAEDRADAGIEGADDMAAAGGTDGCTMTAQMAKSMSQLRMSASSSNFPSLDCRCSVEGPGTSTCNCAGPCEATSRPVASPLAAAAANMEVEVTEDAASHLDPPWSHNSCCLSSSHRPTSPAASMRHLAVSHRSERVCGPTIAVRSASFRRRPSSSAQHHQHHQQQHHQHHHQHQQHQNATNGECSVPPLESDGRGQTYPEYLQQVQERVQLWLLDSACEGDEPSTAGEGDYLSAEASYRHGNRRATMPDNHTHNDHWSEH